MVVDFGYCKAGKDLAAAVMGAVIGALFTVSRKITNLLWELF